MRLKTLPAHTQSQKNSIAPNKPNDQNQKHAVMNKLIKSKTIIDNLLQNYGEINIPPNKFV